MLAFLHIPKTGGTTLIALRRATGGRIVHVNSILQARALAEEDVRSYSDADAFVGHMPVSIRDLFPQAKLAVFLRDPVDRVISAYAHVARTPRHASHALVAAGMSLVDFAREMAPEVNAQVRRLCNYPFADAGDARGNVWWNRHGIELPASALTEAKANLSTVAFIGVVEHYERDARLFCDAFDIEPPAELPRLNVASNSFEVNLEDRRAIEQINAMDRELYQFAKHLVRDRRP